MALPTEILAQVDLITLKYTATAYQAVVNSHLTELRLMLVIYFALFGFSALQGYLPLSMSAVGKHILKALIIFQMATNWGTFSTFAYNGFTHGPEKLTQALMGGDTQTQKLEDAFVTGVTAAQIINKKAGPFDISQIFLSLLLLFGTILMVGVALFLLILSKMGLAVLLSLGPIFIALALWKGTQGLFQGWINYVVNYSIIPVITYAILGLTLTVMREPLMEIAAAGENLTMITIVPYLLLAAISVLLFSQVLRISASLGGGISLSTQGAFDRYITRPMSSVARLSGSKTAPQKSPLSRTSQSSQPVAQPSHEVRTK